MEMAIQGTKPTWASEPTEAGFYWVRVVSPRFLHVERGRRSAYTWENAHEIWQIMERRAHEWAECGTEEGFRWHDEGSNNWSVATHAIRLIEPEVTNGTGQQGKPE